MSTLVLDKKADQCGRKGKDIRDLVGAKVDYRGYCHHDQTGDLSG